MNKELIQEIQTLINNLNLNLNCSIDDFTDKVDWNYISSSQKLSENFIREFKDTIDWYNISEYQKLSESFIIEFQHKVNWLNISICQKLSENFIKEFKDKVNIELYKKVNKTITYNQKVKECKEYCEKHNLEFDYKNKCFYAYRDHNFNGSGIYCKNIYYEKGKYYRDWHLDMREREQNSFGLGIFPKGNTKVKVLIEDWGVETDREYGKSRVWGFEVI
jgi:hypothetical protein